MSNRILRDSQETTRTVAVISRQVMNELFEQMDEIDFKEEKIFLKQQTNLDQSDLNYLESLYTRWLMLIKVHPDLQLIPNAEIDTFWHAHLVDKSKYEKDCFRLFGRNLDHKEMREADLSVGFALTKSLWKRYFDEELREPQACCSV